MNMKKQLGNRIKELRLKKSYTQEDLAEQINLSSKSLSQIELGNNFVSAETLEAICNALEISPKALFDFEKSNPSNLDALATIVDKLQKNPYLLNTVHKIVLALDE